MKRWMAIGLVTAFVMVGAASAEARGRSYHHRRPHHRSHVSFRFGLGCWPRYRSSYVGLGYSRRGWSVGLSWWPSYRSYYYVPSYPAVYTYAYTYPTYVTTYPSATVTYPTTYSSYRVAAPAPPPPQPQVVQGWYHPTYGFWCPCHGYQKESLAGHSYQYDTTKDAKP